MLQNILDAMKTAMLPINRHREQSHPCSCLCSPNLRKMVSSFATYFGETYRKVFGLNDGPPLHDAMTIAYAFSPALFQSRRLHLDAETRGEHSDCNHRRYIESSDVHVRCYLGTQREKLCLVGVARGLSPLSQCHLVQSNRVLGRKMSLLAAFTGSDATRYLPLIPSNGVPAP